MERNEWSYADLAEKLGTSKSQAHDWANGTHEPNLSSLREIAKKLDCKIIDLIDAA
jgi:transcriptional regulator with XRE-family HTH domain